MQQLKKRKDLVTLVVLLLVGSFLIGYEFGGSKSSVSVASSNPPMFITDPDTGEAITVDFSIFWKVWNTINEKYVATKSDPVSDQEKVWGAIQGLTNSLGDPYTVFFPPEDLKLFESDISGNFEGVGMEIGIKENTLTVVAPLKDTPAYRAGLQPGDKIIQIDGVSTASLRVDEAVGKIRGERGTDVVFTVVREGKSEAFDVTVTRAVIQIPTIETELKKDSGDNNTGSNIGLRDDGVFIIRLFNFSAPSSELFRGALRDFVLSGSDKLIIDLRGNPGGYLESAVDMASWFLPTGKIIVNEDYGVGSETRSHRSHGYNIFSDNLKMVVLVNGGSASASEILAGALKEHGVATIVGTKTFGKGSVQELVPITEDSSIKVTVARWLTPEGHSISENGLDPDVVVEVSEEDIKEERDPQLEKAVEILKR